MTTWAVEAAKSGFSHGADSLNLAMIDDIACHGAGRREQFSEKGIREWMEGRAAFAIPLAMAAIYVMSSFVGDYSEADVSNPAVGSEPDQPSFDGLLYQIWCVPCTKGSPVRNMYILNLI